MSSLKVFRQEVSVITTLIIGANGRIGRRFCEQAARRGHIETDAEQAATGDVSRNNVATALLTLLERHTPLPTEIVLLDGNRPIEQALR